MIFLGDGKLVAAGSDNSTVRIWDATTGASIHTLEGHSDRVTLVVFSGNSKLMASRSWDSAVRIRDAMTGECVYCIGDVSTLTPTDETAARYMDWNSEVLLDSRVDFLSTHGRKTHSQFGLGDSGQWITLMAARLLWLPANLRPIAYAKGRGVIVLGSSPDGILPIKRVSDRA